MAQRTLITLIDDIDGGIADETVIFSLGDVSYEIDLPDENAAKLRSSFAGWASNSRRRSRSTSTRRVSSKSSTTGSSSAGLAAIREWAKENGHEVAERGRIAQLVQDAYDQAHA